MRLLLKEVIVDGKTRCEAYDHDDPGATEPLGIGSTPDEALGNAVRQLYLAEDEVTITDITSEDDEEGRFEVSLYRKDCYDELYLLGSIETTAVSEDVALEWAKPMLRDKYWDIKLAAADSLVWSVLRLVESDSESDEAAEVPYYPNKRYKVSLFYEAENGERRLLGNALVAAVSKEDALDWLSPILVEKYWDSQLDFIEVQQVFCVEQMDSTDEAGDTIYAGCDDDSDD